MIVWPGGEGYNYPFQVPYAEVWARLIDGIGQVAERLAGARAPALPRAQELRAGDEDPHVEHRDDAARDPKLRERGITNVKVNMDWQHLIMNGEHLPEYAALLAAEGLLGHQHANSGWGTFDDDNMVGATAFMETLELAVELRRANYGANGERLGFDLYPYTEDAGRRGQAVGAAVAVHRRRSRRSSTATSCARRSRRRTRCARTSSSTPRSVLGDA